VATLQLPKLRIHNAQDAIGEFVRETSSALNAMGFQCGDGAGRFALKTADDTPIVMRSELATRHGKCYFRRPVSQYWPCADSPGVYIFFTKNDEACYVGKSEASIGSRASWHVGSAGPLNEHPHCELDPNVEYMIAIPLCGAPFLAPALESFLLDKYDFSDNNILARRQQRE
jgi:hypothetical protein